MLAKYDDANWGMSAAVDELRGGPGAFAGLTSSAMTDLMLHRRRLGPLRRVQAGAGLIDRRNEASVATPRSKLWYLGAAYNVTPAFVVDGELFKLIFSNSPTRATLWALRGTYSLSKRTAVYANVGYIDNAGTTALSVSNAAAGGAPGPGGTQTGFGMGIRHSF